VKVRYLPEGEIELAALAALDAYGRRFEEVTTPPVPAEEILECHLELDFGFEDLEDAGLGADALGAMWVHERKVRVDSSLDPTVFTEREGRYRFTVAHEVGHWQLHRHLFLADANQDPLFGGASEPSVVCRANSRKAPIEWQADAFAAHLLMPKEMVARAWRRSYGDLAPHFVGGQNVPASPVTHHRFRADPADVVTREMAALFCVSAQAMRIRLTSLGLVRNHDRGTSLFG
jgi:hypothetical protein